MKNRSELFSHFRAFYAETHTQFHVYVQNLRSDNVKEYLSKQFQSFLLQNGIFHQKSCVDTPSQHRVVERKYRHLLETSRALLFQMHMPKNFWADDVSTTCFLINRMPSSVLDWATPFQTLLPDKSFFPIEPRVFGFTCFVWDVRPHVSKLNPKSLKCIFLGYFGVQKGYKCYCPSLNRYLVSVNVTFLENKPFSPIQIHTSQGENDDLLVYTLASPAPTSIPPLTKPPITQVYARRLHPSVSSPPPATSTLDPNLSDDLHIALRKGKR